MGTKYADATRDEMLAAIDAVLGRRGNSVYKILAPVTDDQLRPIFAAIWEWMEANPETPPATRAANYWDAQGHMTAADFAAQKRGER